ncbi:MAG: 30S ribosomal protein S6 [Patescibacteria group bacterium]
MDKAYIKEGIEARDYEIAFLLQQEELLSNILKVFGQYKIEIKSEGSVKKIRLAYDIAKAKEAYFVFFHVSALPDDMKLLEAALKNNAQVLRFLILRLFGTKVERDEASKRSSRPSFRPSLRRSAGLSPAAVDSRQSSAISNEALEKKIEEILQ